MDDQPALLKKYVDGFEEDLIAIGCTPEDFPTQHVVTDGYVISVVIKFRDTKLLFSIRKDGSDRRDQFLGTYVGYFPPGFRECNLGNCFYPDGLQVRLRQWIEEHINVYLEEHGIAKITLLPIKQPPTLIRPREPKLKAFVFDASKGFTFSLSSALFWTIVPILTGLVFWLGYFSGRSDSHANELLNEEIIKKNSQVSEANERIKLLEDSLEAKTLELKNSYLMIKALRDKTE